MEEGKVLIKYARPFRVAPVGFVVMEELSAPLCPALHAARRPVATHAACWSGRCRLTIRLLWLVPKLPAGAPGLLFLLYYKGKKKGFCVSQSSSEVNEAGLDLLVTTYPAGGRISPQRLL